MRDLLSRPLLLAVALALIALSLQIASNISQARYWKNETDRINTATALQATRDTNLYIAQKTAIAIASDSTVTSYQTAQTSQYLKNQQATAVLFQTAEEAENIVQGTVVAVQYKATQSVLRATNVIQERAAQKTEIAIAVQQTVVALPSPTSQPTALLPTITPARPQVNVIVRGCNPQFNLVRPEIGEFTTAFVTIQNVGKVDISDVSVTLKATDEGENNHPDRVKIIQYLPSSHEVTLDLAVDTKFSQTSNIEVQVEAQEGVFERGSRDDCREIDDKTLDRLSSILRLVIRIGIRL
jgi:uncharacterized membrane-anchored protein